MDEHEKSTESSSEANNCPSDSTARLATLGALVSTIAHDLNNLIMTIQGSAEMGLREIHNPAKLTVGLERILVATRHSKDFIEQIQSFKQQGVANKAPVDLRKVLAESRQLVEVKLPDSVELDFTVTNEAVHVHGNEGQLQQVLMNVYASALQSMRSTGGILKVNLNTIVKEPDTVCAHLTIADTGDSIPQDLQDKIFDPLATTPSLGLISGLALAVAKSILDQHNATLRISRAAPQGNIFEIMLPTTAEQPNKPINANQAPLQFVPSHEKKAILLVDDEPFMRGLGMDMLHSLGYRVTVAGNGKEALALVEKKPQYFDIILSDSKMPEMTGPELAEKLYRMNISLPFVLVTAFSDNDTEERLKTIGITNILKKPFLINNLEQALDVALANRPA